MRFAAGSTSISGQVCELPGSRTALRLEGCVYVAGVSLGVFLSNAQSKVTSRIENCPNLFLFGPWRLNVRVLNQHLLSLCCVPGTGPHNSPLRQTHKSLIPLLAAIERNLTKLVSKRRECTVDMNKL